MEMIDKIDPNIIWDIVELPSRGIHYKNNKKSIKVAYLTASDEDILSSVNLIKSNKLVDELLKRKILDKDIAVEELDDEDIKAILIFLRNTSFGSMYSVELYDENDNNKQFTYEFDLSQIEISDFNLIPDSNGEYDYTIGQNRIKFKFLSPTEKKIIDDMINNWKGNTTPPKVTKQLEFIIKSVDGNRDQLYISNYIKNLDLIKSREFRKYVEEQRPKLLLTQKAKSPSGGLVEFNIDFGPEFFRPFFSI